MLCNFFPVCSQTDDELECNWSSDIVRVNVSEFQIFLVEGCLDLNREALHDVLVQVWDEGNVVEVVSIMERLDNF